MASAGGGWVTAAGYNEGFGVPHGWYGVWRGVSGRLGPCGWPDSLWALPSTHTTLPTERTVTTPETSTTYT